MTKRCLTLLLLVTLSLFTGACTALSNNGCYPLKCESNDEACQAPLAKMTYTPPPDVGGETQQLGVISYIVTVVHDVIQSSPQKIFENITHDSNYKNLVTGMMTLFVAVYGIAIALGIAQLSPFELVIRVAKMAIVYYLLTSWANFQDVVVDFFESMTTDLTNILATAVVDSASGSSGTNITAQDVFNFVDEKVLGLLLSVRFWVILGAMPMMGAAGLIISLLLFAISLGYLWTIVVSIQVYIMSSIARALLYAVSPIFILFLLFQQTRSLFESWLKQLINFSLQPMLLVGFLAFFNGIFFNQINTMFEPGYQVCSVSKSTNGQVVHLYGFQFCKLGDDGKPCDGNGEDSPQIPEVLDVFGLFVVLMLGSIMTKMNQWAVQAAAQLSEGGVTFVNTMRANSAMSQAAVRAGGDAMRRALELTPKK